MVDLLWLVGAGDTRRVLTQTRKFGDTAMETTTIGFGSWAVGGSGWAAGWGHQGDEESVGASRWSLG